MRVAVRVYGQERHPHSLLHTFDGGAGLALIENDRLVVDDAVPIQDMGVQACGIHATAQIDPCMPKMRGGFARAYRRGIAAVQRQCLAHYRLMAPSSRA